MSPTFRWVQVVVYFRYGSSAPEEETHEWERWGRCVQIGAVEYQGPPNLLFGSFLVICTFHFFLGCVYRQRWRIFIWYLHLFFFFFFPFDHFLFFFFCLFGLHSGEEANWHKMKWASISTEKWKWEGSLFSIYSLTLFCQPFFHPAVKEEREGEPGKSRWINKQCEMV
jgi:hypothetical protein